MSPRFLSVFLVGGIVSITSVTLAATPDQEFVLAHERMYTNGMTQYSALDAYRPDDRVTREQAAKFFVEFDRKVMGREAETLMYCVYEDEATFDPTLAGSIQSACNRKLMLWSQGSFMWQQPLTKAQALTILIRSLEGAQDESTSPRWKSYYSLAFQKGLTKEKDVRALDRPVTRYEIALLLRRVEHPLSVQEQDGDMSDIIQLLTELGLQTE